MYCNLKLLNRYSKAFKVPKKAFKFSRQSALSFLFKIGKSFSAT